MIPFLSWLLVGVLGALAFPLVIAPFGSTPILDFLPRELFMFVCAGGLYQIGMGKGTLTQKLSAGLVAGIGFFSVVLYWITIAMVQFAHMPLAQACAVVGLLVLYSSLFWAVITGLSHWFRHNSPWLRVLWFGAVVVTVAWCRNWMVTGFPWGQWGYSQARNLPLAQWASVGGIYLVTFLVAAGGATLAEYMRARHSPRAIWVGGTMLALIATVGGGGHWLAQRPSEQPASTFAAGIIQGNIEQSIKNRSQAHQHSIKQRYLQESERARKAGADVLVWPEAAWPGYLSTALERLPLSPLGIPLILGAPSYTPGNERQHLNSAFHIDSDGTIEGRYDKVHLVPFGEYVPLRSILPVEKFVPGLMDFSAGTSFASIGSPPAGALICFDGVFPEIARQEVLDGAQWLVNLTNDGWYGISSAPYQHLDFYVFRAIENARFVVRAANTGVSAAIDPRGNIITRTRLGEQTYLLPTIAPLKDTTLYTKFGNWFVVLCMNGLVIGAAFRKPRPLTQ